MSESFIQNNYISNIKIKMQHTHQHSGVIGLVFLLLFCFSMNSLSAQTGCDDCDTSYRKLPPFVKEDYKKLRKDSCDLKKYTDPKEAKELFCKARYYFSIGNFINSIVLLQDAYMKGTSGKFKFQVLKLVAETYRRMGDTSSAALYDEKVKRALQNIPDIDK